MKVNIYVACLIINRHMARDMLINIGSDNGVSPVRWQAITEISAMWNIFQWNFILNLKVSIQQYVFENIVCKM